MGVRAEGAGGAVGTAPPSPSRPRPRRWADRPRLTQSSRTRNTSATSPTCPSTAEVLLPGDGHQARRAPSGSSPTTSAPTSSSTPRPRGSPPAAASLAPVRQRGQVWEGLASETLSKRALKQGRNPSMLPSLHRCKGERGRNAPSVTERRPPLASKINEPSRACTRCDTLCALQLSDRHPGGEG